MLCLTISCENVIFSNIIFCIYSCIMCQILNWNQKPRLIEEWLGQIIYSSNFLAILFTSINKITSVQWLHSTRAHIQTYCIYAFHLARMTCCLIFFFFSFLLIQKFGWWIYFIPDALFIPPPFVSVQR